MCMPSVSMSYRKRYGTVTWTTPTETAQENWNKDRYYIQHV